MNFPFPIQAYVAGHTGSTRTGLTACLPGKSGVWEAEAGGAIWEGCVAIHEEGPGHLSAEFTARVIEGTAREVAAGILLEDPGWSPDAYVLIPGAVYAGNRFVCEPHGYPPPESGPLPGEDRRNLRIIDLPRLNRDPGPSHLDQLSIDAATPALGIYYPERRKGLLMLTQQATEHGPFNYEILESGDRSTARILVGTPGIRHDRYYSIRYREPGGYVSPSTDRTVDIEEGECIQFPLQLYWFDCGSAQELFDRLFELRSSCFTDPLLKKEIPFSAVWDIIERKQNATNWRESMNLYQTSILGKREPPPAALLFQSGWCGGMISTYPLLQEGTEQSIERSLRSLEFFFTGLGPAGFFYPYYDGTRWTWDPGHKRAEDVRPTTLTRRVGDILYFLLRQLMLLRERGVTSAIQPHWERACKRNAEAILELWRKYGELGQYIHLETGEITVRGTTSGALVPAALVLAADYFAEPEFLQTAEAIGEFYRVHDLADGLCTGGPGDAMQAPDSESPFELLESFMLLHETTGERKWLQAARDAAVQGASWAMSYDYRFPEGTALAEIGAQSRGAFLANAQNKTAVPGICTLSGQGLLRLYRKTGDRRFLDFLRETCHTIPQYMGRSDKRIPCAFSGGNPYDHQPEGWICERVNVTQWGEPIGELFAYTTWCEVAMMLVRADIPSIYVDLDSGLIVDFDHVHAAWADDFPGRNALRIENPTPFPARVRVLVEDAAARSQPLPVNAGATWQEVNVAPGEPVSLLLSAG
jgi:hypothetical protein